MLALIGISLLPIIYTDFRYRYVHIWAMAFYWLAALAYYLTCKPLTYVEVAISYTLLAAIILLSLGSVYAIKRKTVKFKDISGLGDLYFLLPIPLLLPLQQIVACLIITCILGLAHAALCLRGKAEQTVPLAGWGAISLITFKSVLLCL